MSFCADGIPTAPCLGWLDNPRGSDIDETLAQMDDLFGDSVKDVLQKREGRTITVHFSVYVKSFYMTSDLHVEYSGA